MRKHLPEGLHGHNLNPETLECPVCECRLIPVELVIQDTESELWYVECRRCNTEYLTRQPIGKIAIPKPISREYVLSLEKRIVNLENFIAHINVTPHREKTKQENSLTNESLTKEYAFLLNT